MKRMAIARAVGVGLALSLAAGCGDAGDAMGTQGAAGGGGTAAADPSDPGEDGVIDDRADIPDAPDGYREFLTGERMVPAKTEIVLCYYLDPEPAEFFTNQLVSYQGRFGHHLVLFRSVQPKKPGTVSECTSAEDMANLVPVMSSINFGLEKFPEGMGIRVPGATQMVMQQHIVNTSDSPIRVDEAIHLRILDKADVKTLAGFYGVSDIEFSLPPGEKHVVEFDCVPPHDMNLLMIGTHMHEHGTKFRAQIGQEGSMKTVIEVDPWEDWYRDSPPIEEWSAEDPFVLKEGDIIRTRCEFDNTSTEALEFPSEMCASYGYYFPAPMGAEAWTCAGAEE
jgi:hypothetical protein